MEIRLLDSRGMEDYFRLAEEHGSVFNTRAWLEIYDQRNLKVFGIFDKGGLLTGGFQIYQARRAALSFYRNPPFSPHIGLFYENRSVNPAKAQSAEKNMLTAVAAFLKRLPWQVLSVALPVGFIDAQPFTWDKFKVVPGYTYRLDLTVPVEETYREMMPERRNDISKAVKDGIEVTEVSDMAVVEALVQNTFERQSKSLDKLHLGRILRNFPGQGNSFAMVAFQDGKPLATCFCIFDGKTVYYLLGGYDSQNRHKGAGALAIWKSVEKAESINRLVFDFEGSMVPWIERYFRGFGGRLTPYLTINRASMPLEIFLKFIKRDIF
ncbi:MAG: GNAT family N-acetyltransferase [Bacteroidetes bacterium]|nr:GNAT family N-acetyltransferase [Bacteroidota bacterium]